MNRPVELAGEEGCLDEVSVAELANFETLVCRKFCMPDDATGPGMVIKCGCVAICMH